MFNKKIIVAASVLAITAMASNASAVRPEEPKKANKFSATLVRAYDGCDIGSTNTNTSGALALPACSPSVPSDTTCSLEAGKASAKVDIKEKKGFFEGSVKVSKLVGCDGEELCAFVSARVTTQNCASGDPDGCTVSDDLTGFGGVLSANGFDSGICCTVSKGSCKVKLGLNEALGSAAIVPGDNTSVTIGRVNLQRTGGGNVLSSGLLSK